MLTTVFIYLYMSSVEPRKIIIIKINPLSLLQEIELVKKNLDTDYAHT